MEQILPIALLLLLLAVGVPVAWSMAVSGIVGIWYVTGSWDTVLGALPTIPTNQATAYTLITIPLFILLAYIISSAKLSDDMYDSIASWTGNVRGGLPVATIWSGAVFGAMSGASVASATVMSRVAYPSMRRNTYPDAVSTAAIAAGSTLSTLIPPSIVLIIFGISTETSIGRLLVAGIVPALILAVLLSAALLVWSAVGPRPSQTEPVAMKDKIKGLTSMAPSVALIVAIIGLLYTGVMSPTEVAAAGALMAILLAIGMRRLPYTRLTYAVGLTLRSTCMIFALLIGAGFFARYLTLARVPQSVLGFFEDGNFGPVMTLVIICAIYIVGCMFMDELPFMIMTLPVTFPIMMEAGYDPVWYGVLSVLLINFGLIAPPVGMISFVVSGATGVEISTVYKGALVMLVPIVLTIIVIAAWPELVLSVPNAIYNR